MRPSMAQPNPSVLPGPSCLLPSPSGISPASLLSLCSQPSASADQWFDGGGVEKRFYHDLLGSWLGPSLATHLIPQFHLSTFIGADANGQRGDFLVNLPGQWLVIELDDPTHESHLQRDDVRDAALQKQGVKVLRIPYSELQSQRGLGFDEAVSIFATARRNWTLGPLRFVAISSSKLSSVTSSRSRRPRGAMPALLTRRSSLAKRCLAKASNAARSWRLEISHWKISQPVSSRRESAASFRPR